MTALNFPDAPTNGQIYDKWTWNGTQWVLTAGLGPKGLLVYAFATSSQGPVTVKTPITGLTATWTAAAGRIYRVMAMANLVVATNTDAGVLHISKGGTDYAAQYTGVVSTAGDTVGVVAQAIVSGLTGSQTFIAQMSKVYAPGLGVSTAATVFVPAILTVEDVTAT